MTRRAVCGPRPKRLNERQTGRREGNLHMLFSNPGYSEIEIAQAVSAAGTALILREYELLGTIVRLERGNSVPYELYRDLPGLSRGQRESIAEETIIGLLAGPEAVRQLLPGVDPQPFEEAIEEEVRGLLPECSPLILAQGGRVPRPDGRPWTIPLGGLRASAEYLVRRHDDQIEYVPQALLERKVLSRWQLVPLLAANEDFREAELQFALAAYADEHPPEE